MTAKNVIGYARVIEGCRFTFWADITPSKVEAYLKRRRDGNGKKRGISAQTSNYYLQAVKQFCGWMVSDGRASESPITHLKALNARTDRRHERRALTVDELGLLLRAAQSGPERFGMTGPDRAMLYRLAVESGLRRGELASLMRSSFDLDGSEPTATVEAAHSKRRREDVQPLPQELADALREHLTSDMPDEPAFNMPARRDNAIMFRADLDAAGIPYRDDAGRVADFHALRHTFISNLVRARGPSQDGAEPRTAQHDHVDDGPLLAHDAAARSVSTRKAAEDRRHPG
ncbi:MAG: tyrosine-type recombinase/integrase [Planctomycetota bacterium]|nr:tyrosine-type recombinase/integrase [Planctomycetota bacterium]